VKAPFDSLPEQEPDELEAILRIIFNEFQGAIDRATQQWKMRGRILKVLLIGAGRLKETPQPHEHDPMTLLIVVNDERLTDHANYWAAIEARLSRERRFGLAIRREVNLMVYSFNEVNRQIGEGIPFFVEFIVGTTVYDDETTSFGIPRHLSDEQARAASTTHFDFWYPRSVNARKLAKLSMKDEFLSDAAFLLHQAAERAYHCVLLVLTLHSPKTHRLEILRSTAERVAPVLGRAWTPESKFTRRAFNRLRRAYGAGRYDPDYKITTEELRWLDERIGQLQALVRIEKAIHDLPTPIREAFRALRLEGLENEEIAQRLGLTVSQVEKMIAQALDSIADALPNVEH
jgi:HEPN domain-containing protein